MTIVHITPSFLPNRGGVETHVAAVVDLQQKNGHTVAVITKPAPHTKIATWKFIFTQLPKLLQADVIHVHDVFWWLLPIFPLLFLHHKKIVTTFHGWEGQFPIRWQAKAQRWVYNQLSSKTVHVGAWIQEFYWDKPDLIVYGGVGDSGIKSTQRRPFSNPLQIIFIGRLESENDIELYFDFLDQLKKENVRFTITWVGDGSYCYQAEKYGEVTGMVSNVGNYISKAKIVLASSYLSMLESQAAGKIVIALYSNMLKQRYLETYPGSSAMVVTNNPTAAVINVKQLLSSPKKQQEITTTMKKTIAPLTWNSIVDSYQNVYLSK